MRALPKWRIRDEGASITSACFSIDGNHLIVAAGGVFLKLFSLPLLIFLCILDRILIYDNGNLVDTLRGHKDSVNSISCARDGKKFASASADKTVIIWTSTASQKYEGLLKYSHSDSVQCLAFNPISHQLASCAVSDFAFWSTEQKAVQKYKVPSKICCCAWTNDGQYIALGMANGTVSIRSRAGVEKTKIERPSNSPVFGVAWSPSTTATSGNDNLTDTLSVVDWSKSLSFYNLGGQFMGKERPLSKR